MLDDLLERNREWANERLLHDPSYFDRLMGGQHPRVLWIGCSDSRVPAEHILNCGPGEIFIHRNVANVVAYNDINVSAVIEYGVNVLEIQDIVICGHYGCGGVAAACADAVRTGYIGDWLMIIGWAKRWVDERLASSDEPVSEEEYLRLVVEENVRLQLMHLSHLSIVRSAWQQHADWPRLHGWVYEMATGQLNELVRGQVNMSDHKPALPQS